MASRQLALDAIHARNACMLADADAGKTLASIARAYGICTARAQQIVARERSKHAHRQEACNWQGLVEDMPLEFLQLPRQLGANLLNAAAAEGWATVGDVLKLSRNELLRIPRLGIKTMRAFYDAVDAHRWGTALPASNPVERLAYDIARKLAGMRPEHWEDVWTRAKHLSRRGTIIDAGAAAQPIAIEDRRDPGNGR
ncbi:MAG TPA: hypothetical protein VGF29_07150 [Hyphomicrobiaceae bacterium]|jgi:hypothetical protein